MILAQDIADALLFHNILTMEDAPSWEESSKNLQFEVNYQCTVSMANWVSLHKMLEFSEPSLRERGSYGFDTLLFEIGTEYPDEIIEALLGLEDYPLIDDEEHSALEQRILDEDLEPCVRDFTFSNIVQDCLAFLENEPWNDDEAFSEWFTDYWQSTVPYATEHIECGTFWIDFCAHYDAEGGLECIMADYRAHREAEDLKSQGFQQPTLGGR